MAPTDPNKYSASLMALFGAEVVFATTLGLILTKTSAKAFVQRIVGLAVLVTIVYYMEKSIVQICRASGRVHWSAIGASLLWIQLLSASELILASRVDSKQLPGSGSFKSAVGLLWNMRRVNTKWQVKNVPSNAGELSQSRSGFLIRRLAITLVAYLFLDMATSMAPPDPSLVQADKATLLLYKLGNDDIIFRSIMSISYWITSAIINTLMVNTCSIVAVLLGFSSPADCPPLHGSFLDAFTVRRFWGISWHQMFRSFLTGHADLIVDNALPFLPRHSFASRYLRLTIAFLISGVLHYRSEQLMGVPNKENQTIIFFLLQALVIMLEDAVAPITSAVLPKPLRRGLGWIWVMGFLIWTTPTWVFSGTRLGLDSSTLLPVHPVGSYIA